MHFVKPFNESAGWEIPYRNATIQKSVDGNVAFGSTSTIFAHANQAPIVRLTAFVFETLGETAEFPSPHRGPAIVEVMASLVIAYGSPSPNVVDSVVSHAVCRHLPVEDFGIAGGSQFN